MNLKKRTLNKYVKTEALDKELSKARYLRAVPISDDANYFEVVLNKRSQRDIIPVQVVVKINLIFADFSLIFR